MKKLSGKYIEMAINSPELLIDNYLNNSAFEDSRQWNIIGEAIYELFPFLSLLVLFDDEEYENRSIFIEKNKDIIKSECCNFEQILTLLSPYYREQQKEQKQEIQKLREEIANFIEEKEVERMRFDKLLEEKESHSKYSISKIEDKLNLLTQSYNALLNNYNLLKADKINLSDSSLISLILYYFKKKPIFDITRLTDDTYCFEGLLKSISEIAGVSIHKGKLYGKTIDSAFLLIREQINLSIEKNRQNIEEPGCSEEFVLQSFDKKVVNSILQDCCGGEDYVKWDTFANAQLDINKLINSFKEQFGVELHENEIKNQNRMDNLEDYLFRRTWLGNPEDPVEIVKNIVEKIRVHTFVKHWK